MPTMEERLETLERLVASLIRDNTPGPPTISAAKAGEMLGIATDGVIALVKGGLLPGQRAQGRNGYAILESDVLAFKAKMAPPAPPPAA